MVINSQFTSLHPGSKFNITSSGAGRELKGQKLFFFCFTMQTLLASYLFSPLSFSNLLLCSTRIHTILQWNILYQIPRGGHAIKCRSATSTAKKETAKKRKQGNCSQDGISQINWFLLFFMPIHIVAHMNIQVYKSIKNHWPKPKRESWPFWYMSTQNPWIVHGNMHISLLFITKLKTSYVNGKVKETRR